MATSRPIRRSVAACLLGAAIAACSSTPSPTPMASSGGGGLGGGAATGSATGAATPASSQGTTGGGGGGQTVDVCKAIAASDVGALLGKSVTANGPVAGEAQSCSWYSDDLTNAYLYRTDSAECADTKGSLTGTATVPGADFAGPNAPLDATFAGKVTGDACYVVEVTPTERAPQGDAIGQLLELLVQRVGG
jgi:hypothetical protein